MQRLNGHVRSTSKARMTRVQHGRKIRRTKRSTTRPREKAFSDGVGAGLGNNGSMSGNGGSATATPQASSHGAVQPAPVHPTTPEPAASGPTKTSAGSKTKGSLLQRLGVCVRIVQILLVGSSVLSLRLRVGAERPWSPSRVKSVFAEREDVFSSRRGPREALRQVREVRPEGGRAGDKLEVDAKPEDPRNEHVERRSAELDRAASSGGGLEESVERDPRRGAAPLRLARVGAPSRGGDAETTRGIA